MAALSVVIAGTAERGRASHGEQPESNGDCLSRRQEGYRAARERIYADAIEGQAAAVKRVAARALLGMSAMTSAPAQGMPAAEGVMESGLVGGIFSKAQHDSIRVKFSDVDWATIVRAGNLSQTEVSSSTQFSLRFF